MADLTEQLAQSFNGTSPAEAVAPCCKEVRGEWEEYPKVTIDDPKNDITYLGPGGVYTTYYLDSIPKGLKATVRLRVNGRIRGALVCRCMDDGRTLSEMRFDQPFSTEVEMPVAYYNVAKAIFPGIGWAVLAYQVMRALKKAYDVYNMSPELVEALLELAGPAIKKAVEEIAEMKDNICRNKHKCAGPPPPPGLPGPPAPVDPSELIA